MNNLDEMDYNSIVPLYAQMVEQLEQHIRCGRFNDTGRLPTESKLSEMYSVSRITVRRAVDELVAKGLVEKKQGKGTFICMPKMSRSMSEGPMGFTEMCEHNGMKAGAKLLDACIQVPESEEIRRELGLEEGQPAVRIRRVRYADGRPLVLEDSFYAMEYSYLLGIDLENVSTYRYLREEKGIEMLRTSSRLRLIRIDSKTAKLLQVPKNSPQIEIRGKVVRADGQVIHTSYNVGYGEDFEFIIR